ncbi:hypothetical protein Unana1_07169 [Umbelopsis nana]
MAAETRYPSRRRSSRQTPQVQQTAPDTTSPGLKSMSLRTRSNPSNASPQPAIKQQAAASKLTAEEPAHIPSITQSEQPPDPVLNATSEYRRGNKAKILWYATPPLNIQQLAQPEHSAKYLYWKQQQQQQKAT